MYWSTIIGPIVVVALSVVVLLGDWWQARPSTVADIIRDRLVRHMIGELDENPSPPPVSMQPDPPPAPPKAVLCPTGHLTANQIRRLEADWKKRFIGTGRTNRNV